MVRSQYRAVPACLYVLGIESEENDRGEGERKVIAGLMINVVCS